MGFAKFRTEDVSPFGSVLDTDTDRCTINFIQLATTNLLT